MHTDLQIKYRPATPFDAPRIAALHARSWGENYRGEMSDDYLDREAPAERLSTWTDRFSDGNKNMRVQLAEVDRELIGFCCIFLDHDPDDGTLLDNLHVRKDYQGKGIGKKLMQWAAGEAIADDREARLYLWVLKSNTAAAATYLYLGGEFGRTERHHMSGTQPEGVLAICVHFDPTRLAIG